MALRRNERVAQGRGGPTQIAVPARDTIHPAWGSQTLQSGEMHGVVAAEAVALGQVSGPLRHRHIHENRRGRRLYPFQQSPGLGERGAREPPHSFRRSDRSPKLDVADVGTGEHLQVLAQDRQLGRGQFRGRLEARGSALISPNPRCTANRMGARELGHIHLDGS